MTGPEHYRAAEEQLHNGARFHDNGQYEMAAQRIAIADVHAVLALTSAVALLATYVAGPLSGQVAGQHQQPPGPVVR